MPDQTIVLPGDLRIPGTSPVVIVGANGSGKTRMARDISTVAAREFVNALRNTRVAAELPSVGVTNARQTFNNQRSSSMANYWEIQSDFDYLLAKLHAEDADAAISYRDQNRTGATPIDDETVMDRVRRLWSVVFPGRELRIIEGAPKVRNVTSGDAKEYSAHTMSDAEKSALYLAAKTLNADPGVIIVDEPEMHFHTMLASMFWDTLEQLRPDLRFVYITHDLQFALSRLGAKFVLVRPQHPPKVIDVSDDMSPFIAEALLGAASFSFRAQRIVFCEGIPTGLDLELYRAWFDDKSTVVRSVGNCDMVMRCCSAFSQTGIATGLTTVGIIDRDFHPDELLLALPSGVTPLGLHEVESLYCLPEVVSVVSRHVGRPFDLNRYEESISNAFSNTERHKVIIERWKRRVEPNLQGVMASVSVRESSLDDIASSLEGVFDQTKWRFSPSDILQEEKVRIESAVPGADIITILRLMPGKPLVDLASTAAGLRNAQYRQLVNAAVLGTTPELAPLGQGVRAAMEPYLPPSTV